MERREDRVLVGVRIFRRSNEKLPEAGMDTRGVEKEMTVTSAVDVERDAANEPETPPMETETWLDEVTIGKNAILICTTSLPESSTIDGIKLRIVGNTLTTESGKETILLSNPFGLTLISKTDEDSVSICAKLNLNVTRLESV
jgi:hypothetical protein